MAQRAVHWYEGMFLRPHHFQVADRQARDELRGSEDWYHPFNWGIRSLELDRDAVAKYEVRLQGCEVRFKDGTKLTVPADGAVDPLHLKQSLDRSGEVTVSLAVPTLQTGRANVEEAPTANGPRYWIDTVQLDDENTGGGEQPVQIRRVRSRLLLSDQDTTGYEVLPLARITRTAQVDAPPQIDLQYVPPLLILDAWPKLWRDVQGLFHQIGAKIEQLAEQVVGQNISFDSQVPGEAERLLKLATLNAAYSHLGAVVFVAGQTPLEVYQELCRIVGQLAIFSKDRRPPALPNYDHEDIGGCYYHVIKQIQLGLDTITPTSFEKRYFERAGERLLVGLEPAWLDKTKALFLGVETELGDEECEQLLRSVDMKLGSSQQVEQIFKRGLRGLRLVPIVRPPKALPAGGGTVYYQIERDQVFWREVAETYSMAIQMKLTHATFQSDRILSVTLPRSNAMTNLQFALFVIGPQ
jgi:type VI secretion system protein ImpJ